MTLSWTTLFVDLFYSLSASIDILVLKKKLLSISRAKYKKKLKLWFGFIGVFH